MILNSAVDPRHVVADPDPTFHFDAEPDPDPSFQIKDQNLEKCSNRLIFHTLWLVISFSFRCGSGSSLSR
jgi:hypothetical protein